MDAVQDSESTVVAVMVMYSCNNSIKAKQNSYLPYHVTEFHAEVPSVENNLSFSQ